MFCSFVSFVCLLLVDWDGFAQYLLEKYQDKIPPQQLTTLYHNFSLKKMVFEIFYIFYSILGAESSYRGFGPRENCKFSWVNFARYPVLRSAKLVFFCIITQVGALRQLDPALRRGDDSVVWE